MIRPREGEDDESVRKPDPPPPNYLLSIRVAQNDAHNFRSGMTLDLGVPSVHSDLGSVTVRIPSELHKSLSVGRYLWVSISHAGNF